MGSIFGLTSVFLIVFPLAGAETAKKHRSGVGSLAPITSIKPTLPGVPRLSQGAAPRRNTARLGAALGSAKDSPAAPSLEECSGKMPLEKLFEQPKARSPALAPRGVYYFSDRKVQYQTRADTVPETLLEVQGSWLRSTYRSFLPTLQAAGTWFYWSSLNSSPSQLKVSSALTAPSETWVATFDKVHSVLSRRDLKNQATTTLARLEGDYTVRAISPDEGSIALVSSSSKATAQLVVWRKGNRNLGSLSPESDVAFTKDGTGVFFLRAGYQGQNQLVFVSLETGRTRPLTALTHGVNAFGLSRDGTKLVFTSDKGPGTTFGGWKLSPSGRALQPLQLPEVDGTVEGAPAVMDEGEGGRVKFFFAYSSHTLAPALWFWDSEQAEPWTLPMTALATAACGVLPMPLGSDAVVFPPPVTENAAWVLFPQAKFEARFNPSIQYFHRRGFGVFVPETFSKPKAQSWLEANYGASSERVYEFLGNQESLLAARKAAEEYDAKLQALLKASPFKIK